jgi:RNA polymerase sigma-70 factor (ECF subfamily)
MGAAELAETPYDGGIVPLTAARAPLDVRRAFGDHAPRVRGFLGRLGIRSADLEDLSAETFLIAHLHRERFDPGRPVLPWLLGIAARLARKHRRKIWMRGLLDRAVSLAASEPAEPRLEERLGQAEDQARVRRALEQLPEKKRLLLVLREYEELSCAEIGVALEMPEASVYSALHYARKELLKRYRRLEITEGLR